MTGKIWKFSAPSTWVQIDDFLINKSAKGDVLKEIELAGYNTSPMARFGSEFSGFSAEIFASNSHFGGPEEGAAPFKFLAQVELSGIVETVALEELPDLVEFLSKISTIAEMAAAGADRYDAERGS